MKTNFKIKTLMVAMAAVSMFNGAVAFADSSTATTTSGAPAAYRAPAIVDFRIVIPAFVYFQVGSPVGIDTVTFSPLTTDLGTANSIAGSQALNVVLRGNNGAITIEQSNGGNLIEAGGVETIPFSTISTATSDAALPAPSLATVTSTTGALAVTSGRVTNRSATWTYAYVNATLPSAGTYGASGNSGRVTYTAVMP